MVRKTYDSSYHWLNRVYLASNVNVDMALNKSFVLL